MTTIEENGISYQLNINCHTASIIGSNNDIDENVEIPQKLFFSKTNI